MRTIIDLTDEQLAALKQICDEDGISRAEAIRRAVGLLRNRHERGQSAYASETGWEDEVDPRVLVEQLRRLRPQDVMHEPREPYGNMSTNRWSSYEASWYDDAMKTLIDLEDEQVAGLDAMCAREAITRAEAIRRAVGGYLEEEDRREHARVVNEAFGAWTEYGVRTDDYLAEIRQEWEH